MFLVAGTFYHHIVLPFQRRCHSHAFHKKMQIKNKRKMKKTVHSDNDILVFISSKNGRTLNIKPLKRRTEKTFCFFFFSVSVLCFVFHYNVWSAFDSSHFDPLVNTHTTGQTWSYFHIK